MPEGAKELQPASQTGDDPSDDGRSGPTDWLFDFWFSRFFSEKIIPVLFCLAVIKVLVFDAILVCVFRLRNVW
jgi:hypothetical protein